MDDTLFCPICNQTLKNSNIDNTFIYVVGKSGNYVQRVCTGYNHLVAIWTDKVTQKVDIIKIIIGPVYSRVIEVDFFNKKTQIQLLSIHNKVIEIPKILDLDFPDLKNLQSKIEMYSLFI